METLVTIKVSIVLHSPFSLFMETQERIVRKAHELFMRYGVRSVSMDDVANHLGISKKTIYQFYADKDALVDDVLNIEINSGELECTRHKQKSENAIHEVFLAIDYTQEILTHMNPSVIIDIEKYYPRAFKKYTDFKSKFLYAIIRENIEWGKKEGLYRQEIDSDIIARFRLASTFMILNPEQFPLGKNSISTILSEISDNFLYGLSTSKGLKLIQKYKQQRLKTISL